MQTQTIEQILRSKLPQQYKNVINYNMNVSCSKYCIEPIENIENFNAMINDKTLSRWECHHRLETQLNLSAKQLHEMKLYYYRPASELIFLKSSDHQKIHHKKIHKTSKVKQNKNTIDITQLEQNRLLDFKALLTYIIVMLIDTKFNKNYEYYYKLLFNQKQILKCSDCTQNIINDIIQINNTTFSSIQIQHIFGQSTIQHYKHIIEKGIKQSELLMFNNGTLCINSFRISFKKRYSLPYEYIKNIFLDKNLLSKVRDASSDFYTDRQRRLIFTQIIKQKQYHYKTNKQLIKDISEEEKVKVFIDEFI